MEIADIEVQGLFKLGKVGLERLLQSVSNSIDATRFRSIRYVFTVDPGLTYILLVCSKDESISIYALVGFTIHKASEEHLACNN
jgi:hypothetical protein